MISACTQPDLKSFAESDLNVGSFEKASTDCNPDPVSATEQVDKEGSAWHRKMKQVRNKPSEPIALRCPTMYCTESLRRLRSQIGPGGLPGLSMGIATGGGQ